ncbi:MFS transporter [Aspergillus puulaauensis]|uniref:Major facilitator superfamily (MFS) profile domain-containing protein n=1 Tax=Aspergillus puulaauensis TaxID=1220207 RepID=A0A7R7XYT1_9EURO|nr:uncharacterized protein APUU_80474S [Aspergillus puulaauensis]BCS30171.1 hypothetical protein APUU_80474S [Aspergillus puulaauensis]
METPNHPRDISFWRLMTDQHVVTHDIVDHKYPGSGTESDPYVVSWIPDDPRNPMNFAMARKVLIVFATGFSALIISLSSSGYSGSMGHIIQHFNVSEEVATLGLSLFVIGFSLGPVIWAPLSESIGRQIPFFISFLAMAAFCAGCAGAQNIETLLVLRFFAGAFGSSPLTNAGGIVSDMFTSRERGLALLLFAATPYIGPAVAPMIGGFLSMNAGWRWVEGLFAASSGLVWLTVTFSVPETYAPVLLRKRAAKLSQITGHHYRSNLDIRQKGVTLRKRLQTVFSRPWILLFTEPIVFLLTFYAALIYGTLYMLFAAFPIVYQQERGWNPGVAGLPFLGVLIGMLSATIYTIWDNKRYINCQNSYRNGVAPPEARLPPCMLAAVTIPTGLFWFAWTNSPSIHWMAGIAALVPFGFGLVIVYVGIVNYLVDSYTIYAASVLASMSVVRYMFGGVFPLFTSYMYKGLGIHWASSIPAFVAVACIPLPFVFYVYGERIRKRCKYAAVSAKEVGMLREGGDGNGDERVLEEGNERRLKEV